MKRNLINQFNIVVLVVFQIKQNLIKLKGNRIPFSLVQRNIVLKIQKLEKETEKTVELSNNNLIDLFQKKDQ